MEFFGGLAAFRKSQHTLPSFVSFWADLDCFSPIKENGMNTIYPATKKARETSYPVWLLSSETTFLFIAKKNGFSVAGLGLSEKSGSRLSSASFLTFFSNVEITFFSNVEMDWRLSLGFIRRIVFTDKTSDS